MNKIFPWKIVAITQVLILNKVLSTTFKLTDAELAFIQSTG
jgi:hypothetical protein